MAEPTGTDVPELNQGEANGSIWSLKPWWCQPWSIVLTGMVVIAASWMLLQRWWISAPAAMAVLLWWWLFLVVAPAQFRSGANLE
ncbi:MAG: DUF6737 family protein [Cyanobacteria bacterium J06638_7]